MPLWALQDSQLLHFIHLLQTSQTVPSEQPGTHITCTPFPAVQITLSAFSEILNSVGSQDQCRTVSTCCIFSFTLVLCSTVALLLAVAPSQEYWLHHELIHGLSSFRDVPALPQSIFQFSNLVILSVLSSSSCFLSLLRLFHQEPGWWAQLWPRVCPGWNSYVWHRAASGLFLPQRSHLQPPPAAKPFHWHLTHPLRDELLQP